MTERNTLEEKIALVRAFDQPSPHREMDVAADHVDALEARVKALDQDRPNILDRVADFVNRPKDPTSDPTRAIAERCNDHLTTTECSCHPGALCAECESNITRIASAIDEAVRLAEAKPSPDDEGYGLTNVNEVLYKCFEKMTAERDRLKAKIELVKNDRDQVLNDGQVIQAGWQEMVEERDRLKGEVERMHGENMHVYPPRPIDPKQPAPLDDAELERVATRIMADAVSGRDMLNATINEKIKPALRTVAGRGMLAVTEDDLIDGVDWGCGKRSETIIRDIMTLLRSRCRVMPERNTVRKIVKDGVTFFEDDSSLVNIDGVTDAIMRLLTPTPDATVIENCIEVDGPDKADGDTDG